MTAFLKKRKAWKAPELQSGCGDPSDNESLGIAFAEGNNRGKSKILRSERVQEGGMTLRGKKKRKDRKKRKAK